MPTDKRKRQILCDLRLEQGCTSLAQGKIYLSVHRSVLFETILRTICVYVNIYVYIYM